MTQGDAVLLPPAATNLIEQVVRSLTEAGLAPVVEEVTVVTTKMILITVTGKRAGEGQIAAEVKRRQA